MSDQMPPSYYPPQNPQPQGGYPPAGNPYSTPQPDPYQQPNPYQQQPNQYQQPNLYQQGAYPGYAPGMMAPEKGRGMAVAGLVLGIISVATFIIPGLNYIDFLVPILGIIFSAMGRRSYTRRTMATWGLVLSIIGLALFICTITIGLIALSHLHNTTY